MKLKNKNKNLSHNGANVRRAGTIFLIIGILLVLVSLMLNFIFIDEEFKASYKQKQYEECILNGNTPDSCRRDFIE